MAPTCRKSALAMEAALGEGSAGRLARGEAQAFKRRWNAAEREELASTPVIQKFRQLAALLASAGQLGWTEALAAAADLVRERWVRLRVEYHA